MTSARFIRHAPSGLWAISVTGPVHVGDTVAVPGRDCREHRDAGMTCHEVVVEIAWTDGSQSTCLFAGATDWREEIKSRKEPAETYEQWLAKE